MQISYDLSVSLESSQLQKGHLYFSGDDTHEVKVVLQDKEITADLELIHRQIATRKRRKTKTTPEQREVIVIDDCDDNEPNENEQNLKDKMKM